MPVPPKTYAKSFYGAINTHLSTTTFVEKHDQRWFSDAGYAGRDDGPYAVSRAGNHTYLSWLTKGTHRGVNCLDWEILSEGEVVGA